MFKGGFLSVFYTTLQHHTLVELKYKKVKQNF